MSKTYWNPNESHAFREGAKRRDKIKDPKKKIPIVMSEFKHGSLHSGSGDIVTNRKQAVAIAMSEARKHSKTKKR